MTPLTSDSTSPLSPSPLSAKPLLGFPNFFKVCLILLIVLFSFLYGQKLASLYSHPLLKLALMSAENSPEITKKLGNKLELNGSPSLTIRQGVSGKVYLMRIPVCGSISCGAIRARSEPQKETQLKLRFVKIV
jgi:hypothetical protein